MAYTTTDDIIHYFMLSYTDSEGSDNFISESEASQFIDEQTVIIDLKIAAKYTLPITNSSDLIYLKLVCDKLVVCQIDKILRAYATDDESEFARRRNYCKEANKMLEDLISGEIILNSPQAGLSLNAYNKTTVYDKDSDCRVVEVDSND